MNLINKVCKNAKEKGLALILTVGSISFILGCQQTPEQARMTRFLGGMASVHPNLSPSERAFGMGMVSAAPGETNVNVSSNYQINQNRVKPKQTNDVDSYINQLSSSEGSHILHLTNPEVIEEADKLVKAEKYNEAIILLKAYDKILKDFYSFMVRDNLENEQARLTTEQWKSVHQCIDNDRYDAAIKFLAAYSEFNKKVRTG